MSKQEVALYDKELASKGLRLTKEEVVVPILKLMQPVSANEENFPGKFHLSMTGETFDSFEAVILANNLGQVMWNPDRGANDKTLCGSSDRIIPSSRFTSPIAPSCAACNFHRRGYAEKVKVGGQDKDKKCNQTISLIGAFGDTLIPFIYVAQVTALFTVKNLLQTLRFKLQTSPNNYLYNYLVEFSSSKATSASGVYFVPKLKILKSIDGVEFKNLFEQLHDYNFDKTFDEQSEIVTETTGEESVM
jgi:hypothetical protein